MLKDILIYILGGLILAAGVGLVILIVWGLCYIGLFGHCTRFIF